MKKIKAGQTIVAVLPEAMILLSQVSLILCCYFVFIKNQKDFYTIALLVSFTMALVNFTILFNSLRPWRITREVFYGSESNAWASGAFTTLGLYIIIIAYFVLIFIFVVKTSYSAAQLMLISGCGLAIIFAAGSFFGRKSAGLKRNLFKKFKVWHLSIILYCAAGIISWFIADWNPTLKHYTAKVQVKKVMNHDFISEGDFCEADIGTYPIKMKKHKCRIRFFCGGKRLFGGLGLGMIQCKYNHDKDKFYIIGEDPKTNDGDGAFRINTKRNVVQYSTNYSLYKRIELKSKIVEIKPFSVSFLEKIFSSGDEGF